MRKILLIGILLITNATVYSQVYVNWANYPGGVAVAADAMDNAYTASWDYNSAGDITLTRWSNSGTVLWNASFNNTDATRHEVATWLDTDGDGNILVSGTIRSGYSNPVNANSILMKFNPAGNLIWRRVYETGFDGSSTVKCLIDAQNSIYVLGLGNSGSGIVTCVKKISSAGASLWTWFDTAGIGAPLNFKFTPEGNLVISARGRTGSINGFTKIDPNGIRIWSLGGINSLTVGDAAGDANGNTYIINGQYVATNAGSIVRKLSPTGTAIWERTNTMAGMRIEVGSDNCPVICGFPNSGTAGAAFMKYDINGNILWQNPDADGPSYNLLSHAQLKLDGSNAAYLAASIMSQMAVCKVNSNGTTAWTATISGSYPVAMDFGSANRLFVVGGTTAMLTQNVTQTPPAAPSNLTAAATGTSTISIAWTDNASNETSFIIQRSLSATGGFTTIATLAANTVTYTNSGLAPSTKYYYQVQSANGAGSSAWSNVASATTTAAATVPAAPSALLASPKGCLTINLTWTDNSNNETGFTVARSTSASGTYSTVATLPANTINYTNTGLTKGRNYYYQVKATNAIGSSTWSPKANATASCLKSGSELTMEPATMPYPNPVTNGWFNLNLNSGYSFPATIQIFSLTGQKVMDRQLFESTNTIDTRSIPNGFYLLSVRSLNQTASFRLQINN